MPRRSNLHTYPFIRWFASAARKQPYLWSFRSAEVIPALYAGCILALMPLYGVQIVLAFILAYFLRANFPLLVGLQMVSNPLTIGPIYYTGYEVGRLFLGIFGFEMPVLTMNQLLNSLETLFSSSWYSSLESVLHIWLITMLGGAIMGTFMGAICSMAYRFVGKEIALTFGLFRQFQAKRRQKRKKRSRKRPLFLKRGRRSRKRKY